MDKFKEKLLDKIIDEVMNAAMGLSKDEVQSWIQKNKSQKLLLQSIKKFCESNIFKREFKNVGYEVDEDVIYSLTDEDLNVALTVTEIKNNIFDAVSYCFGCEKDVMARIAEFIAVDYLQRAKAMAEIYDVISNQHKYYNALDESISDVKEWLVVNAKREEQFEKEKQGLLKNELENEMKDCLTDIMNRYLYFVHKESVSMDNPTKDSNFELISMQQLEIKNTIENIAQYVGKDFYVKNVVAVRANGFNMVNEEVGCFQFLEFEFKNPILICMDSILKYKDIIDLETYVCLLRIKNILNSNWFPSLYRMGQTNIINNKDISVKDLDCFRKTLIDLGENILLLCDKLC